MTERTIYQPGDVVVSRKGSIAVTILRRLDDGPTGEPRYSVQPTEVKGGPRVIRDRDIDRKLTGESS